MVSEKNKHLFLVFTNFDLGGVQRKMADIANYISTSGQYDGYRVHLIVKKEGLFSFKQFLNKNPQIAFHSCFQGASLRMENFRFLVMLIRLYFQYRPQVVLSFFHYLIPHLLILKVMSFFRLKIVIGQDNILSWYNQRKNLIRFYPNWVVKFLLKFPDKMITQTQFAKQDLIDNFFVSEKKIVVIPNWVVRAKIKETHKRYDLIYSGRFAPQKRVERVLMTMFLLKKKIPSAKLILVGSGSEEKVLRRLTNKLKLNNNVDFLPPTRQILFLLNQSKILILTSDFEGQPMVMLEAMATRTVPVVLEYPGVDEYLEHEQTGFVENSLLDLTKRIEKLLRDKKKMNQISLAAQKRVAQFYNEQLIQQTLEQLLNA